MGDDKRASMNTKNNKPNFLLSIIGLIKFVKLGLHYFTSHAMYLLLVVPLLLGVVSIYFWTSSYSTLYIIVEQLELNLVLIIACSVVIIFLGTLYFTSRPRNVFLVDFACYKPGPELMCPTERFMERSRQENIFTEENLSFQRKIVERSGLGEKTYLPESFLSVPAKSSLAQAGKEAEIVIFGCVDQVLRKTGVKAEDVGIVVTNSSLFDPTPSFSAMVVKHYNLKNNVKTYNLAGMGCSAGLISIDLAKHLLQASPNCYALVVSLEVQALHWYLGNDRSILMSNCIFRQGGAAVLLSNRPSDRRRSKYQLIRTIRTHKGSDEDQSYNCVSLKEDENGKTGVSLSKELMVVAGQALKTNITTLGPLVLPMSEQLFFFLTLVARKVFKMKVAPYILNFKLALSTSASTPAGRWCLMR